MPAPELRTGWLLVTWAGDWVATEREELQCDGISRFRPPWEKSPCIAMPKPHFYLSGGCGAVAPLPEFEAVVAECLARPGAVP